MFIEVCNVRANFREGGLMKQRIALLIFAYCICVTTAKATLLQQISPTADGNLGYLSGTFFVNDTSTLIDVFILNPPVNDGRGALEFDLGTVAIPTGYTLDSVTLNIYSREANLNIGVHGYSGDGVINILDFTFENEIATFDPAPDAWNTVGVTDFVAGLLSGNDAYAGFQLRELVNGEVTSFLSSESNLAPYLELHYTPVPEPTTLALLSLGLAGLGFTRRRMKA
jgi:hypothetical protein